MMLELRDEHSEIACPPISTQFFTRHPSIEGVCRQLSHLLERGVQLALLLSRQHRHYRLRVPPRLVARTNSAGSVKVNVTGQTSREANQELFLFQKVGNEWKIARYCFSTTNPPRS